MMRWSVMMVVCATVASLTTAAPVVDSGRISAEQHARPHSRASVDPPMVTRELGLGTTIFYPARPEAAASPKWATPDTLVTNPSVDEAKPSIAVAPDGTMFVAVERLADPACCIYRSVDHGQSWFFLVGFASSPDTRNPTLTYLEDNGNAWLVMVYEVVVSDVTRNLRAVRVDPDDLSDAFLANVDAGIPWTVADNELHPRIISDFPDYTTAVYLYVTWAIPGLDYYPVYFSRSTDLGLTWDSPTDITGGSENSSFESRPDISYCANDNSLYVAFNKPGWTGSAFAQQIWVTRSGNTGTSWSPPVQLTFGASDNSQPAVAAAWDADTVVVASTIEFSTDSDVSYVYSDDAGATWSAETALPWSFDDEGDVDLAASSAPGGRFHAVYRHDVPDPDGADVWYTWAEVSNPHTWSPQLDVDAGSTVSGEAFYPKPAIAVDPSQTPADEAAVVWTSYQGDHYDVYFDSAPATNVIFMDDFESGDLGAWSASAP